MAVASTRIPVVRIAGDVTGEDCEDLKAALAKAATDPPVVLDLSAAGRIDDDATTRLRGLVELLGRDRVAIVRPAAGTGAPRSLGGARTVESTGQASAELVEAVQHELADRRQNSSKPSAHAPSDFSGTDPGTAGFGDHRRDLGPLQG